MKNNNMYKQTDEFRYMIFLILLLQVPMVANGHRGGEQVISNTSNAYERHIIYGRGEYIIVI